MAAKKSSGKKKLWQIERDENGYTVRIRPSLAQFFILFPQYLRNQTKTADPKVIVAAAGTGGGKTSIAPIWFMARAKEFWDRYGHNTMFVGGIATPTIKIGSEMRRQFKEFVHATKFAQERVDDPVHGNRVFIINPPRNGVIYTFFLSDTGNLEGKQGYAYVVDEGDYSGRGRPSEDAYGVIIDRTNYYDGKVLITTTPYGIGGPLYTTIVRHATRVSLELPQLDQLIDDFRQRALPEFKWRPYIDRIEELRSDPSNWRIIVEKTGDMNYLVIHYPSIMNPNMDPKALLRGAINWPEDIFRMRYFGRWAGSTSNVVFPIADGFNIVHLDRLAEILDGARLEYMIIGLDPANKGATGVSWSGRYVKEYDGQKKVFYVIYESAYVWTVRSKLTDMILRMTEDFLQRNRFGITKRTPIKLRFDPQTQRSGDIGLNRVPIEIKEALSRLGFQVTVEAGNGSVVMTLDALARKTTELVGDHGGILVLSSNRKLIKEAGTVTHDNFRNKRTTKHLIDSIRYGVCTDIINDEIRQQIERSGAAGSNVESATPRRFWELLKELSFNDGGGYVV